MERLGYYNGQVGPLEEMQVPMLDRAMYFGDGCYDGAMGVERHMVFSDIHLDRFYNSARLLGMEVPMSREELADLFDELLAQVDAEDTFVYWQISRGTALRDHAFPKDVPANLMVMVNPRFMSPADRTMRLVSFDDKRFGYCNIKTINLIPSVLAAQAAAEAGVEEAVFVRDGFVTECAHSNVSILKDGVFVTHPLDNHVLPGTSLRLLMERAAPAAGIAVEQRLYTLQDLMEADEVILSASGSLCQRIVEVDGKPVGGKDEQGFRALRAQMDSMLAAEVAANRERFSR